MYDPPVHTLYSYLIPTELSFISSQTIKGIRECDGWERLASLSAVQLSTLWPNTYLYNANTSHYGSNQLIEFFMLESNALIVRRLSKIMVTLLSLGQVRVVALVPEAHMRMHSYPFHRHKKMQPPYLPSFSIRGKKKLVSTRAKHIKHDFSG